jgi:homospermidine synthase
MGFAEEALDWVQVGWGTHERPLPSQLVPSEGPVNQVFVPMHAMEMVMSSYVPHESIKGMCIPHGEADTITEHLTVYDATAKQNAGESQNAQGNNVTKAVYRPSVYYVYQCAQVAMESLDEMRKEGYIPQSSYHVLTPDDEGLRGEDRVGVLLMFEDDPARVLRGETTNKKPWSYW